MNRLIRNRTGGFTVIELMIIVAVITVILTMAVPAYSNYSIRAKIGEAFTMITAVESATAYVCQKERSNFILTNQLVGYNFQALEYVKNIVLSGTCTAPTIMVTTRATGAQPSPMLTITGNFNDDDDEITWTCMSSGLNVHVPRTCRS